MNSSELQQVLTLLLNLPRLFFGGEGGDEIWGGGEIHGHSLMYYVSLLILMYNKSLHYNMMKYMMHLYMYFERYHFKFWYIEQYLIANY